MIVDTIIAPASAIGGGVAVIRLSGPKSFLVLEKISKSPLPHVRHATLTHLVHPETNKLLDHAIVVIFQAPHSFTGEDIVELHVHGGRAVVQSILQACLLIDPSIRLAEGGEFAKRAYLNGKIDLTAAEAIADLVAAETEAQADLARDQMQGGLYHLYESWRTELIKILAHLEATIDFVDEEDVPQNLFTETTEKIRPLIDALKQHLSDGHLGERLRDGFIVTIIGAPNSGKSSLMNCLAKRDVAIVSPIAGTTRDALEVSLNLGGYPVILIDTAGLRETEDQIESMGIERAYKRAQQADIVLALFDATQSEDSTTQQQCDERTLRVYTKADLLESPIKEQALSLSTISGQGIQNLLDALQQRLAQIVIRPKDAPPLLTRARHRAAVENALTSLSSAIQNNDIALLTEDVRLAMRALGRLTGRVDVEDLLDIIFKDFCIGK